MLNNFFKIAWRNLIKNYQYSLINIGGLAIGLAVSTMIGLWVYDELTYNTYHKNYSTISQVYQHANFNGKISTQMANPAVMAPEIKNKYGSYFKHIVRSSWGEKYLITIEDKPFYKQGNNFDPEIVDMLGLNILSGSGKSLTDPYTVLLARSTAIALFGKQDPIGKIFKLNRKYDVKVGGVYEDLPANTTFKNLEMICTWALWEIDNTWAKDMEQPWGSNFMQIFAQIADNTTFDQVNNVIKNVKLDNVSADEAKYQWVVFLHPMSKWNLHNQFKDGKNIGGDIQYVWLFGMIGLFVLVLACINFMNLTTARSEKRAKEVGIRKSIGSVRSQLISQFYAESYLVVLCSFVISILLVLIFLSPFNTITNKKIEFPWSSPGFWGIALVFTLITGLLAGSYPALYLSSFSPVKVLKGTFKVGKSASLPRQLLVVIQFTVSVLLIIGTVVVYQQVQFAKNRPIGYSKNGLISMQMQNELRDHFDAFKQELISTGTITDAAASGSPLTGVWNTNGGFEWEGKDPNLAVDFPNTRVSIDYGNTVGWKINKGRDFSKEYNDSMKSFIINESAARFLGFDDPIGKTLKWNDQNMTIIGVVSDILQESPFFPVRPSLYHTDKGYFNILLVKLHPDQNTKEALARIETVYKKFVPGVPFEYTFVDNDFAEKFRAEERIGKLASYFSILAILISCLGLFGMASFVAEQRTKEIGIRKVLGAGVFNLWKMLSKEFVLLVSVSCLVAAPIAYLYLHSWLQEFDYRVSIQWWVFILAAIGALTITLCTVSYQSIKAALINPIKSLRME